MIKIHIHDISEDDIQTPVIVEILPGEWDPSQWEFVVEKLAKSERKTIFRMNYFDSNGLVLVIIRHWFQYRDTMLVETSDPDVRETLEFVYGKKVIFTDTV